MKLITLAAGLFIPIAATSVCPAASPTAPYTENFETTANWSIASGMSPTPPTLVATGGPDGSSYISRTATMASAGPGGPFILFRAADEYNSSGHAFEGDWIAGGLNTVSVYVKHNAPFALPFFIRFTPPPGTGGISFQTGSTLSASPNWTKLTFDISPDNPYYEPEIAMPSPEQSLERFNSRMSDVGHIQVGFTVPASFAGDENFFTYSMDRLSAVPEPASLVLALGGLLVGIAGHRRRR